MSRPVLSSMSWTADRRYSGPSNVGGRLLDPSDAGSIERDRWPGHPWLARMLQQSSPYAFVRSASPSFALGQDEDGAQQLAPYARRLSGRRRRRITVA